jgi:hypothetical protein
MAAVYYALALPFGECSGAREGKLGTEGLLCYKTFNDICSPWKHKCITYQWTSTTEVFHCLNVYTIIPKTVCDAVKVGLGTSSMQNFVWASKITLNTCS